MKIPKMQKKIEQIFFDLLKKIEAIFFDLEIIAFELVALNTGF